MAPLLFARTDCSIQKNATLLPKLTNPLYILSPKLGQARDRWGMIQVGHVQGQTNTLNQFQTGR